METDNRLIFRLPASRKSEFVDKVEKEGKKISEVLNELVETYLNEPEQKTAIEELNLRLEKVEEIIMGESLA